MIDLIEYYMYCKSITMSDCFKHRCKFSWFCGSGSILRVTNMIYSEGE